MAVLNRTRIGLRNQKKSVCASHAELTFEDFPASGDVAQVFAIPEDSLLTAINLNVKEAFNAGASIVIAATLNGAPVMASISIATTGIKTLTVTKRDSGAGGLLLVTCTIVGAVPTAGKADLIVDYTEYTKNSGEYTEYSTT